MTRNILAHSDSWGMKGKRNFLITAMQKFIDKEFNLDNREVFAKLPCDSIDLILTDPPYKDYQSNRPLVHNKVTKINQAEFDLPFFLRESARVLKPGHHFYCWCDHLTFPAIFDALRELQLEARSRKSEDYLVYKNCLVWVKNNHGSGNLKGNWAPQHEFILFATKGKGLPLYGKRPSNTFFKRTEKGIEFYKKVSNYRFQHGTSKPVEILKLMLRTSTMEGDLVLDPYAGSMSVGEACILTGRHYLLVEIDPNFFKIGLERLEKIRLLNNNNN